MAKDKEYNDWKNAEKKFQQELNNSRKVKLSKQKPFLMRIKKIVTLIKQHFPEVKLYEGGVHEIIEEGNFFKATASGYGCSEIFIPKEYAFLSENDLLELLKKEKKFKFNYDPG